jgi:hypothetical protein
LYIEEHNRSILQNVVVVVAAVVDAASVVAADRLFVGHRERMTPRPAAVGLQRRQLRFQYGAKR